MRPDETEEHDDQEEECEDDEIIEEGAPVREDKIFNNRYNTGEGLSSSEEYSFSNKISVAPDYSDTYLKDIYEYEEGLETSYILNEIFRFFRDDLEINRMINRNSDAPFSGKVKLSKEEVNFIFNRANQKLEIKRNVRLFFSPVYIVEAISSISSIEYRKLFDMFDTEIQEMLLLELNKKYQFLDGKMHKKRIH